MNIIFNFLRDSRKECPPDRFTYPRTYENLRRFLCTLLWALTLFLTSNAQILAQNFLETLTIETKGRGNHIFHVEVMRTEIEKERGLMSRAFLAEDRGMLFDFRPPHKVTMWMRETRLSLDMIFIDSQGVIKRIVTDTEPMSESLIPSGEPIAGVLEVRAGTAALLKLQVGDMVRHPIFEEEEMSTQGDRPKK